MVLEWYCNYGTLFKLGPFIFSTYGVAVGLGGFMHYHVVMTFLSTFVASGLLAPAIGAQASVLAWVGTAITVLGWRMCSMFIEDIHEIRAGNIIGAFLRPGYLEAGGNSALMIYAFLSGLGWGTDLSLNGLKNYMLLSDAFLAGYYLYLTALKLGCVVYGCCWGITMAKPAWYSTYYTSPNAKCLRTRPDLLNKPLFPISSIMAMLFTKNSALCFVSAMYLPYVPGLFTALLPWINRIDKNIYFPYRGDGQETGYVPGENFFMVDPPTKKAHCLNWAVPAKYNCFFAVAFVVYTLATQSWSTKLQMTPAFDQVNSTHAALAFGIPACAFGYFYKEFGMWLPAKTWPDLVAKKTK